MDFCKIKYTYSPKYSKINRDLEIGDIILIEDFLREYPIFRQANNEWRSWDTLIIGCLITCIDIVWLL